LKSAAPIFGVMNSASSGAPPLMPAAVPPAFATRFCRNGYRCQPWTERCPVDIDPRFFSMVALEELGRTDDARDQRRWTRGIVNSVLSSGERRDSPRLTR